MKQKPQKLTTKKMFKFYISSKNYQYPSQILFFLLDVNFAYTKDEYKIQVILGSFEIFFFILDHKSKIKRNFKKRLKCKVYMKKPEQLLYYPKKC